jgi:hypothetical protein
MFGKISRKFGLVEMIETTRRVFGKEGDWNSILLPPKRFFVNLSTRQFFIDDAGQVIVVSPAFEESIFQDHRREKINHVLRPMKRL